MSPREIIYYFFYSACFVLSVAGGIILGFTDSHTPPIPFIVELFALPIGFILFLIDSRMWKSTKVHKIGLAANGLVMAFVLALAFM